jgi:hypothetical protein
MPAIVICREFLEYLIVGRVEYSGDVREQGGPLSAINAYLNIEWKPCLYTTVHESEQRMDGVKIHVQAFAIAGHEFQALGLTVSMDIEGHTFQASS